MASYVGQAAIKVNLRPQLELSHTVFLDLHVFSRVVALEDILILLQDKKIGTYGTYHSDVP